MSARLPDPRSSPIIADMRSLPLLMIALLAACSGSPANVAGNYTVTVTSHDNGCNFNGWTVNSTSDPLAVTITQKDASATASVNNPTGAFLDLWLGDHNFTGTVDGDFVHLTLFGTRSQTSGNCTYTYNAELNATVTGNAIMGTLDYVSKTNGNPDCTSMGITGCKSEQALSGSRPAQ